MCSSKACGKGQSKAEEKKNLSTLIVVCIYVGLFSISIQIYCRIHCALKDRRNRGPISKGTNFEYNYFEYIHNIVMLKTKKALCIPTTREGDEPTLGLCRETTCALIWNTFWKSNVISVRELVRYCGLSKRSLFACLAQCIELNA